ncbi:filamentous hemagglutinin N-terminal domain-containing protein, partial [filamentous cyanobacterium LEGE 11480]
MKFLIFSLLGILLLPRIAWSQSVILPDDTLGAEQSQVNQSLDLIEGGVRRGQNLFHSFREFNISDGLSAYFIAPDLEIQNIFARVTGINRSEILGVLGTRANVNGTFQASPANLFFLNPNGILFGPNASLDVGGSFVTTTANAIQFGDQGSFSATNPTNTVPLLNIDPSAFLFNAINRQAAIVNQSSAQGTTLSREQPFSGLQVPNGQSLVLLGGDVQMAGGILQAPGGRVELGGLAGVGAIGLIENGNNLQLAFPGGVTFADVSLINNSRINTQAGGGGDIQINAQNIQIRNGSNIFSGIAEGLGSTNSKAGDINVQAQGLVTISNSSAIGSGVLGTGKGGNIKLIGRNVDISNASQVSSVSAGQGNAGDVSIQADDTISFSGRTENGTPSGILTSVVSGNLPGFPVLSGNGKGGNIHLQARSISLADGAIVSSSIFSLSAPVTGASQGQSGNISIEAGSLTVTDGAQLNASTFGEGNAGDVSITVRDDATFNGVSSSAGSAVAETAVGQGGTLALSAGSLTVTNGAQLNSSTFGEGDAGDVSITVRDDATFNGVGSNGFSSSAGSAVAETAVGQGGTLALSAGSLTVIDGAQLNSSTFGEGDAGDISITVRDDATFNGVGSNG